MVKSCTIKDFSHHKLFIMLISFRHYLGSIIGKKGATVSRIGRDTKTDIKIPRQGENKDVTIYGANESVSIFPFLHVQYYIHIS